MSSNEPKSSEAQEQQTVGRVVRFFLCLIMLFPLLAVMTYDWCDLPQLCSPSNNPPRNAIGLVGAWTTFYGYSLLGLGYWFGLASLLIYLGTGIFIKIPHKCRALALLLGAQIAVSGLLQLNSTTFSKLLSNLNTAPNAGGAVGYWLVTCALERLISPVGTTVLLTILLLTFLALIIGVRNLLKAIVLINSLMASQYDAFKTRREQQAESQRLADDEKRERIRVAQEVAKQARDRERATTPPPAPSVKELQRQREANLRKKQEESARALREQRTPQPIASDSNLPNPTPAPDPEPTSENASLYPLPPLELLNKPTGEEADAGDVDHIKRAVVDCLSEFKINVQVTNVVSGPVVTQFELVPDRGVAVNTISSKSKDLMMRLAASSLRIQAPIPGKSAVGLEIPNAVAKTVTVREILETPEWQTAIKKFNIPLSIGKDAVGRNLFADLTEMPHLLVAGSTNSGKSVCVTAMIAGLLMTKRPEEVRFIMIDPKRVEFTPYEGLPHLLVPVITDIRKVCFGLQWAVVEMERRYRVLQDARCQNIATYNHCHQAVLPLDDEMADRERKPMPYIVVVVDEVAEIMNSDKQTAKHAENCIARLTAKSRAVGIHLILATQRPSTDVITGQIKGNIAGRIALKVASGTDSRIILDDLGAENLIGRGDMLLKSPKMPTAVRAQSAFMTQAELDRVVDHIKKHCPTNYDEDLTKRLANIKEVDPTESLDTFDSDNTNESSSSPGGTLAIGGNSDASAKETALFNQAIEVLRRTRRASTSALQRSLKIGYNTAANIMDMLEEKGIVGPSNGASARTILVDLDNYAPEGVTELELASDNTIPLPDDAEVDSDINPIDPIP